MERNLVKSHPKLFMINNFVDIIQLFHLNCFVCYFSDLGIPNNPFSAATLQSEVEMDFLRAAMTYVTEAHWTYYIGGSNYISRLSHSTEVTPFSYSGAACNLEEDSGKDVLKPFTFLILKYK